MNSKKAVVAGHVISILASLMFVFSGVMKFKVSPELEQGFAHLGLPLSMRLPLALLELACVAVYLIPATAVLGAILLAGYVGGTIVTHWRVGDVVMVQILLGLLVWLGVYLREPRLRSVLPLRTSPTPQA